MSRTKPVFWLFWGVLLELVIFTSIARAATVDCSATLHDSYRAPGVDGRSYPTWHPATHGSGCAFGHEHGDDPTGSPALVGRAVTFGMPAYYAGMTEPHAGFKVERWDNVQHVNAPNHAGASVVMTVHQGTSGAARFTTAMHSVQFDYINPTDGREVHLSVMAPFGALKVGCQVPELTTTSPDPGSRIVSGPRCFNLPNRPYEDWPTAIYVGYTGNRENWRAYVDPHFAVFDPHTYCQPVAATAPPGWECTLRYSDTRAGTGLDPLTSAARYRGVKRETYLNQVWLENAGRPTVIWTDAYGAAAAQSVYAIPQFVAAKSLRPFDNSAAFGVSHNHDPQSTVRAPN